jgi:hypothetical protein
MLLLRRTLLRKTFEVVRPCEKLLYRKSPNQMDGQWISNPRPSIYRTTYIKYFASAFSGGRHSIEIHIRPLKDTLFGLDN